jgi:nucleoside-diphosphate-sugar epimerase
MTRGLAGELPPLVHPDIARDYVYIDDVSEAYLRAASYPGQERGAVYNVGTGKQTTLREVVDVARRVLGVSAEARWGAMPQRVWDTHTCIANSQKIHDDLAWSPRVSFEDGFRDNPNVQRYYNDGTTPTYLKRIAVSEREALYAGAGRNGRWGVTAHRRSR